MIEITRINSNILLLKSVMKKVWFCVVALELVFFPSIDALIAMSFSSFGLWLCGKLIFTSKNLLQFPVSTIAIIMYPLFFMFLPPIATMVELKPVVYNLHSAYDTYMQMMVLFITLLIIHYIYRHLRLGDSLKLLLKHFGFYDRLTPQELWSTIIISLVVYVYAISSYGLYDEEMGNTRGEMPIWIQAISFVFGSAYSIVFVFYMKNLSVLKKPTHRVSNILVTFVILVSLVTGIATNMRTASIVCFSTGMFIFIVYDLYYPIDLKRFFSVKKLLLFGFAVYFFTGPFMDISNAMLLSRGDRYGMNGVEVLEMTLSHMGESAEEEDEKNNMEHKIYWDEEYLDNHILNRFCSVKILDESVFHAKRCGYSNPVMRSTLYLKVLDDLPGPIKNLLGIKIPEDIRHYSLTDKLFSLSVPGSPLGGVKIGTLQGLGLALWGWWYIPILIPIYLILFYLLDSAIFYYKGELKISYWFLFNVVDLVYWFSDRHYYQWEFRWIMRTFFEGVTFFIIYMKIVKKLPLIKH